MRRAGTYSVLCTFHCVCWCTFLKWPACDEGGSLAGLLQMCLALRGGCLTQGPAVCSSQGAGLVGIPAVSVELGPCETAILEGPVGCAGQVWSLQELVRLSPRPEDERGY